MPSAGWYCGAGGWSLTLTPLYPRFPGLGLDLTEDISIYSLGTLWPAPRYSFPLEELTDDNFTLCLLPELTF